MGFSLTWLAVRGKTPDVVQRALGLSPTEEREEFAESALCGAELPDGWYLVVANDELHLLEAKVLAPLSKGAEIVAGLVEEHSMSSAATAWKDGVEQWWVAHPGGDAHRSLEERGALPSAYSAILERLKREQAASDAKEPGVVDHIFDVPVELGRAITGYRYDSGVEGAAAEPFVVLERG